jgi:hypothetical protein
MPGDARLADVELALPQSGLAAASEFTGEEMEAREQRVA